MRALLGVPLVALLAACGGGAATQSVTSVRSSGTLAGCQSISGKHHAYVEIVDSGRVIQTACVGFDTPGIDALTLLKRSGIEDATQKFSFGTAICQLDRVPASYSQCLPQNAPYWADWTWDGSSWAMVQTGPEQVKLTDHEALGWVYTSPTASPSPPPPPPHAI